MDYNNLKQYCEDNFSISQISNKTGKSKTTIRYWLKKYNLKTSYPKHSFDLDLTKDIIKESKTYNEVLKKLNKNNSSKCYSTLRRIIERYNIDTSHFLSKSEIIKKGFREKIPNKKLFTINTHSRATIKKRIIDDNLINYSCSFCGISDWRGNKLILILDHINGNSNDNKLLNLRFMCPNCNSQLKTHCRRKS